VRAATTYTRSLTASIALAGIAGALFDAGLIVSEMTKPAHIIGFLDLLSD